MLSTEGHIFGAAFPSMSRYRVFAVHVVGRRKRVLFLARLSIPLSTKVQSGDDEKRIGRWDFFQQIHMCCADWLHCFVASCCGLSCVCGVKLALVEEASYRYKWYKCHSTWLYLFWKKWQNLWYVFILFETILLRKNLILKIFSSLKQKYMCTKELKVVLFFMWW